MRKHFIWLLLLSGCGAGTVQIADEVVGVSGNGHPDLVGEWVDGTPRTCQPGPCWGQLWRFDERGRFTAAAYFGGLTTNLSDWLSDPPGWHVNDYLANEVWITPGTANWKDGYDSHLGCLGDRVATDSVGEIIRIEIIQRATGCTKGFYDLTLSDDGNRMIVRREGEIEVALTRPEALGTRIVSFQWQHHTDWRELSCPLDDSFRPFIGSCPQID